ncbi:hypothetical protein Scep_008088 [Stephania cephalantha]|uniref:Avr9/Cf-9 rapidly elicited protein n=1 Tax=Stephania cephalantha TaxID=152367 RepID=A0AAP0KB17_9MAGN
MDSSSSSSSSSNPPNNPVTKRLWRIVRIVFFMIRKGIISKSKLMLDLRHLMSKRGYKLAGKALANLMFHHHHHHHSAAAVSTFIPPNNKDYEFSCSNSPALPSYIINNNKNKHTNSSHYYFSPIRPSNSSDDDVANFATIQKILEMLNYSEVGSPAAVMRRSTTPSPLVRQLRITDSPFPLRNDDEDYDGRVDQRAEMFIESFYEQLKQQARLTSSGSHR